jgi:hypothetical protein
MTQQATPTNNPTTDPFIYDRISHTIHFTAGLKDALEQAAFRADKPLTTYMREVLAAHVGYDLARERAQRPERRGRPPVYSDNTSRQAARRARDNARKARVRALVTEYKRQAANSP